MENFTIFRLLILFCIVCLVTIGSGEELMNNETVEMILLNTSQYCFVDDNTIRVDLNTTTLLSIIDSSEDVIMAKAIDNDSVIFTAPLNGSRCMDDNEDVKDLCTISGVLIVILCISLNGSTLLAMGSLTSIYINTITVACAILINCLHALAFVNQATKLSILYQFSYAMFQSYKLKPNQEENIKKSILKYSVFIIGSSIICTLLALAIDTGVNGRIYSGMERYCRIKYDYTFLYMTVVFGEFGVFIILQCITFAVGLTLYFLVSKNCCAMKSINFRVTIALVATVAIHIILLLILIVAEVSFIVLIPVVTSGNLVEQLVLLIIFLSSKKVLLVCKTVWLKDTKSPNNQQLV